MKCEKVVITVLCMLWRNDEILLQNRIAEKWPGVTFPGGHVEPSESFVEAVKREMKEETGLSIENPRLCGVKQHQLNNNTRYIALLFKTSEYRGELESSPEGEMIWVKRSEIDKYPLVPDFKELLKLIDEEAYQELMYRSSSGKKHHKTELY